MKIENSSVSMASSHREFSYEFKESVTIEAAKSKDLPAAILSLSAEVEGRSYKESVEEYTKQQKQEAKERQKQSDQNAMKLMSEHMKEANKSENKNMEVSDAFKMKLEMIKRLFEMLKQGKKISSSDIKQFDSDGVLDLRSSGRQELNVGVSLKSSAAISVEKGAGVQVGTNRAGTTWQRITATSGFATESECTTFATTGIVQTSDGRNIDFNVELSMSREFTSQIDCLQTQEYIKTDPLMINLDTNIGSVSDQKFFFDLDADGKDESISFAGKGSGFLALDKNNDGRINDGSELFGTRSGDGFKDLAAYDNDGNGWIDENDDIFTKLKIWTKDENGKDYLMDLKQADIGAIYLGNANTQFSLKNDENVLNAEIKKTGIYLHEKSGAVGTLNHVDLVI